MALDDNARSNATNASYGAPMFLYKLACTAIHTGHAASDSDFAKVLAAIGQWTSVLAWETPASGVAYVLCEGGVDLTTATPGTATAGTITAAEGGQTNNCVITKHVTFA
tara:strand:+ start:83 stop:409 length:327 start_codon:yes stop_codon:yes gene_type:complete